MRDKDVVLIPVKCNKLTMGFFDDFSSGEDGGGGGSDVLTSLFDDAASVATTAINAGNQSNVPLFNSYGGPGYRVAGGGVSYLGGSPGMNSVGSGSLLLVALLALGGLVVWKMK